MFTGRFSLHSEFLPDGVFTFGFFSRPHFFTVEFFTGWNFLHPDFIRAKVPTRGNEPDEIDESSPNRQVICNNQLGHILIGY